MQHFQLYEEWNYLEKKGNNIYAMLGQNLQNYMTEKQNVIVKSRYFDQKFLKEIQKLIPETFKKSLNVNDIYTTLHNFYKDLLQKIDTLKEKEDLRTIYILHLQFTSFLIIAFRFDTVKLLKYLSNDEWFKFYVLKDLKDLRQKDNLILQKWHKIENDAKVKNLIITEFNTYLKNFKKLFNNEKVLKYRDLTKYIIKPDEQQTEAENKIIDFTNKADNETVKQIETASKQIELKLKNMTDQTGFDKEFLKRFDQPGLNESHKLMKAWFLEAFKKAEEKFGKSFTVNSGIRTPEYQKILTAKGYKTAKKSPHIEGVAADVSIINQDVEKIIEVFQSVGFTRFGIGKSFLHVDLGDQLNPKIWVPFAKWTYNY